MKLYTSDKQYASKDELWDSILQSAQSTGADEIENLTKSVDNRLVKVLSNNGNYVNMYVAARNPPICHDIWRKY